MEYIVTSVESDKDEREFISLLNDHLYYRERNGDKKVEWFYKKAPIPGEMFLLRTEDGTPVGTKGYGFHDFTASGKTVRGAISVDICTDENHRSLKPALILNKKSAEMLKTPIDFHYTIPNKNSDPLFRRRGSGFKKVGQFKRYVKILNTRPALEHKISNKFIVSVTHMALNPVWNSINWTRYLTHKRLVCESILDSHLTDLLYSANINAPWFRGANTSEYLSWRVLQNPHNKYHILTLQEKGAIIYYIKENRAHVVDIIFSFSQCEDDLMCLLVNFERYCKQQGFTTIAVPFIGNEKFTSILKKLWYREYKPGSNFWISSSFNTDLTNCLLFTSDIDSE